VVAAKTCSVGDCASPLLALGVCGKHYRLQRKARVIQDLPATKSCKRCGEVKPIESFSCHSSTKDGRKQDCRECHSKYHREQRLRNHRDVYRVYELKRKYGMSLEEFNAMFASQDGKCAICGKTDFKGNIRWKNLCVDHDHQTGKNRGLLCHRCNASIGYFEDDPGLLMKAIEYLRRHGK
jgi:Recombination endonuclease VII